MPTLLCGKCKAKGGLRKETDPIAKNPEIHCTICGNIWFPGSRAGYRPIIVGGSPEQKTSESINLPETLPETRQKPEQTIPTALGPVKMKTSWNIKGTCSNCKRPNMQMSRRHPEPLCGACYNATLRREAGVTEEQALTQVRIRLQMKQLKKEGLLVKPKKIVATSKTKTRSNKEKLKKSKSLFQIILNDQDLWIVNAFQHYSKDHHRSAEAQFVLTMESLLAPYRPQSITT